MLPVQPLVPSRYSTVAPTVAFSEVLQPPVLKDHTSFKVSPIHTPMRMLCLTHIHLVRACIAYLIRYQVPGIRYAMYLLLRYLTNGMQQIDPTDLSIRWTGTSSGATGGEFRSDYEMQPSA